MKKTGWIFKAEIDKMKEKGWICKVEIYRVKNLGWTVKDEMSRDEIDRCPETVHRALKSEKKVKFGGFPI